MNVPVYCSSTLQAGTKGCFLKHTNSNAQREHEDSCLVSEIKKEQLFNFKFTRCSQDPWWLAEFTASHWFACVQKNVGFWNVASANFC